jgi:hypothetical protein
MTQNIPRAVAALSLAGALAACATGGFVVGAADIRSASQAAPPEGQPARPDATQFTDARCRMESATVANCRYRYRVSAGGPWEAASQRLARSEGRWTWVFD